MSTAEIIELIGLCVSVVSLLATIVVSIVKGDMKNFIVAKMEEAEASGKTGEEKLAFVLDEVQGKYKVFKLFLDAKAFIEKIIDATKKINVK